jgi:hypothetical protein
VCWPILVFPCQPLRSDLTGATLGRPVVVHPAGPVGFAGGEIDEDVLRRRRDALREQPWGQALLSMGWLTPELYRCDLCRGGTSASAMGRR